MKFRKFWNFENFIYDESKTRYLKINLTKKYKNYILKNYKTVKEIQDLNEHKNILCLQIRRLLLRYQNSSNWSRVNAIPIRIPVGFFTETDKLILKSIWNLKKQRAKKLWEKGTKWEDSLSDFKQSNSNVDTVYY